MRLEIPNNLQMIKPFTQIRKLNFWKKLLLFIGFCFFLLFCLILLANWRISAYGSSRVYDNVSKIPYNEVGLVLGTSRKLADGRNNLYFKYRIEAAVALYKAQKIKYILVSGDNSTRYYNEPKDMTEALIKKGVPKKVIFSDFAGFRTLDSVIRCKKVFGQNKFTVISQQFHNKRAIYIGSNYGIDVIGFNAKDVVGYAGFKTNIREILARVKVFIDLILGTKPKFLGKPEKIGQ